ncbi:hypothetical protein KP509_16G040100 [Ceratopteris richardii]|uniref:Uncharacterized protein n=1 Tax=Ceratopteris richardii TaxID=49495 RepID=A0A8T2T1S7_CERRI|nr:hypothetical protein KP509_16G040100 [Ceratopteris richardii]
MEKARARVRGDCRGACSGEGTTDPWFCPSSGAPRLLLLSFLHLLLFVEPAQLRIRRMSTRRGRCSNVGPGIIFV